MRRVQSLQNAAARLITRSRRRDHITPVLCQLHWLPVRRRVEFKLTCLVRLYLYLADDIHLDSEGNRRFLRSSSDNNVRGATYAQQLSDRSFGAVGPRIWNSLPRGLRTMDISYKRFKALLETYDSTRPRRFVTFYISALEIFLLTYLLTYLLTSIDILHLTSQFQQFRIQNTIESSGFLSKCAEHVVRGQCSRWHCSKRSASPASW